MARAKSKKISAPNFSVKLVKNESRKRRGKIRILVLHGPNLNLLGEREPHIYGTLSLNELNKKLKHEAKALGCKLVIFQSNHEGDLIDLLHEYRKDVNAVVINPGAYTHYSFAIRDAVASIQLPTFEVHLSDIQKREAFRKISVIEPVCVKQISGHGWKSYLRAIEIIASPPFQNAAKDAAQDAAQNTGHDNSPLPRKSKKKSGAPRAGKKSSAPRAGEKTRKQGVR